MSQTYHQQVLTLIVHPGPPGDAGPAAIDWAIMGDRGLDADSAAALPALVAPTDRAKPLAERQRTHWGITVLQADATMDGGPVWAFDQFPLPDVARATKSSIYQGPVTAATLRAVTTALTRISGAYATLPDPTHRAARVSVKVDPKWALECVSSGKPFLGGPLNERPQIRPGQRRPDLTLHHAADVARIINCGDSQPGGTLKTAKSFMFVYDAKIHVRVADLPVNLAKTLGYASFSEIPAGKAIAKRDGAVLFKTAPCTHNDCQYGCGVGVWFTHGRLPKATASAALSAKVPMAEALVAAGEGDRLEGVPEWAETEFQEVPGTYQQVFVRSVKEGDALVQLVYWDFYNGAMSTTGCEHLVRALRWATHAERGNVKVLALMGGSYFSNGVALNIIESADHPGRETWANINAIDDVVELIAGEVSSQPRSDFMTGVPSLTERGIVTVSCVRGNAAAGGVALAAAADIVVSAGSVVFNPAYRAMGLHGSEFHLYSYVERCGRNVATHLVKDMLPLSAIRSRELGLVDVVVGGRDTPTAESEALMVDFLRNLVNAPAAVLGSPEYPSAPWTKTVPGSASSETARTLIDLLTDNKRRRYEGASHTPLVSYRHEELSQMLLDSFHPHRSQRYHTRRIKFVRKVKAEGTPTRFNFHRVHLARDEEEGASFDDAPGWVRGEEWSWVGLQTPASMATSEGLLIDFAARVPPLTATVSRRASRASSSGSEPSAEIRTDPGSGDDTVGVVKPGSTPVPGTPTSPTMPKGRPAPLSAASLAPPSSFTGSSPLSPKTKRSGLLGRLAGAFRSRSDLRAVSKKHGETDATPAYRRPVVPNEGNTESPCLFNVTADLPPEAQSVRPIVTSH
jgi:enoyl-CoA hydratase/carnithine racemase